MNFKITRRSLLFAGATMVRPPPAPGQAAASAAAKTAKKYQAKAPKTQPFGADAFAASGQTTIRWLGAAGFFINSRGTTLMIDPLLEGFDMPIMIDMPILPKEVPYLDAVLITHSDTDHYSVATCRDLKPVCHSFDSTKYVATVMQKDGLPGSGYGIGDTFNVGPLRIKLTPVDHDWQNAFPRRGQRHFEKEDCCGFWIETPDGTSVFDPRCSRCALHAGTAECTGVPRDLATKYQGCSFELLTGKLRLVSGLPRGGETALHFRGQVLDREQHRRSSNLLLYP